MSRLHSGETAKAPSLLNLFIRHQHGHRHMAFSITISTQVQLQYEYSAKIVNLAIYFLSQKCETLKDSVSDSLFTKFYEKEYMQT